MAARDETGGRDHNVGHSHGRQSTETKASVKTSELIAYIVVFIGILIAGVVVNGQEDSPDLFTANQVWLYITILTLGYMLSRGLAKSGSRESYTPDDH